MHLSRSALALLLVLLLGSSLPAQHDRERNAVRHIANGAFDKALAELERTGGRYGLITMCIGGGQGIALIVERLG